MTGALAKRGRGMPCAACSAARVLPEQPGGHKCTGLAAFSGGTVPCPCCGPAEVPELTPAVPAPALMRFCRLCNQPIRPGQAFTTQLAQSPSGSDGATNHVHTPCPPAPAGGTT